jgi:hypothetical protein
MKYVSGQEVAEWWHRHQNVLTGIPLDHIHAFSEDGHVHGIQPPNLGPAYRNELEEHPND